MSTLLSVDPAAAKPHAWAIFNPTLVSCGFGMPAVVPDYLIIEDQFIARFNSKDILRLAQSAGHLVGVLGFPLDGVEWVRPADWKRWACEGKAPKTKKLSTYKPHLALIDEKLSTEEIEVYMTGLAETGNQQRMMDLADAVCIGLYSMRETAE